jgi:hypothetical protein
MIKKINMLGLLLLIPLLQAAQSHDLLMDLNVNGRKQATVQKGYPVILTVDFYTIIDITREMALELLPDTLKDDPASIQKIDSLFLPITLPETETDWYDRLIIQSEAPGQHRSFQISTKVIQPWPDKVFRVAQDASVNLNLGIDPEITKNWRTGQIILRAGMPIHADTIWSELVRITIKDPELRRITDFSQPQLYFTANYWIRRDECLKAADYINQLYANDPLNVNHVLLMAELSECNNDLEEAFRLYIKADEMYFEAPEALTCPPVYLHWKIQELQRKLYQLDEE